jgi:CRP-like cAMP-binding protein
MFSEKNDVLTRLGAGDFFGEIGILNIDGANRRTADVRSVGYSELFSLSKEDVLEGCRDYPEAERKLYEYAQNRLGFEKAKKEAAEKMKNAFSTLTSIASCLTQNPITTASILPLTVAKISENNSPKENNDDGKNKEVTEQAPLYRNNRKTTAGDRTKYK